MEIGAIIILSAIVAAIGVSEYLERKEKREAYIRELERTVKRQERSLATYRFLRLQEDIKKG